MTRRLRVGFDRRLDREWLDAAGSYAAEGCRPEEVRACLRQLLDGVLSGTSSNSARGKTVTVLSHIWGSVPEKAMRLRDRARLLLLTSASDERLALHWAMMIATYPLFADVASSAGRLLALQGQFTRSHVMDRLARTWGKRSTVERAVPRIIRSMVQWGVLRDAHERGSYQATGRVLTARPDICMILVEALLLDADEGILRLDQLASHPAVFPFGVTLNPADIRRAEHFRVHREGLDTDVVELLRAS